MWNLHHVNDVPSIPPSSVLEAFARRFSSSEALWPARSSENHAQDALNINVARLHPLERDERNSTLKKDLRPVEDLYCRVIRQLCSRHGLTIWCPDLREDAYSLWNTACRIAFYDSFCAVTVAGAWGHLGPNVQYLNDTDVIIQIYDHYVHHHQRRRFLMEAKAPGSINAAESRKSQYSRRIRVSVFHVILLRQNVDLPQLSQQRKTFLEENKFPSRYLPLVQARATSDDELDPSSGLYHIKERPERSEAANKFYRTLDEQMKQDKLLGMGRQNRTLRAVPPSQISTVFPRLPEGMPVDYYKVEVFTC